MSMLWIHKPEYGIWTWFAKKLKFEGAPFETFMCNLCKESCGFLQEEVNRIFNIENDIDRHWNVLKFTCGLMEDSSLLIERVCQAFVKIATRPKPRQSFCQLYGCLYLKDLHREKSAVSINPFNNAHLCYNSHRRIAVIYAYMEDSNCELYYFNGWDKGESTKWEHLSVSKGTNQVEHLKPCSVVIHQGLFTSMDIYLKALTWFIEQPIKNLLIFGENSQQSDCNNLYVQPGIPVTTLAGSTESTHLLVQPEIPVTTLAGSTESTHLVSVKNKSVKNKSAEHYEPGFASRNMSSEPYIPSFVDRNQSELAMGEIGRTEFDNLLAMGEIGRTKSYNLLAMRDTGRIKLDNLSVGVFHKLNCSALLADSLCHCTVLTHLTYIKCRDPRFDTLGKNKELRELTVENCSLSLSTEAELYAQLRYLNQLEQISFKGMKSVKQLARITREGAFSSLTSLKRLSLQDCMLTVPTAVALMESLVQCPLVEIDLSNNFLFGFIKQLHQKPNVAFRHLERMNCNNCDLLKTDTMFLVRLISENRLPVIKTVLMIGNNLANDEAVSIELEKSCEHFRRRKGHRVQVIMDRSNGMRKTDTKDELKYDNKQDQVKDSDKKDEVKDSNKKDELKDSDKKDEVKDSNKKDEVKDSNKKDELKDSDKKDEVKDSKKKDEVKDSDKKDEVKGSNKKDEVKDSDKKDEVKDSNKKDEVKDSDKKDEVKDSDKKDEVKDSDKKYEVKDSDKEDKVQSSKEENETKTANSCEIM